MERKSWLTPFNNNDFWEPGRVLNQFFPRSLRDLWERKDFGPSIDMRETEKEIIIKADLPGVNQEDLDITVDEQTVYLKGEIKHEEDCSEKGYHMTERRYGSFFRTVPLPSEVLSKEAKARYKNGVLELAIPKAEKTTRGFRPRIETDDRH